ncbi:MAG: AI-2E family transporter [Clostridiales bacterium]|nr:AI-2E family transporter [Clostridiales bacterium]
MFKKFKDSPYSKAAFTILICGALLIIFNSWITKNRIVIGFENINRTLAPIYIGGIFAFILCPVYNACVKWCYAHMLKGAKHKGFSVGAMIVHDDGDLVIDKRERSRILAAARTVASLVCVIIVVGLVGLFIYFVVPQVVASALSLINTMPSRLLAFSRWCNTHLSHFPFIATWVDNLAHAENDEVMQWIQEHILSGNAASIATMISNGVIQAFKYVANAFIGLLIMVYLLNYKERLFAITRKMVNATCSQKRKASLYEFADIVNETFIGFIVGRIIDSFIIGVLTFIVLMIFNIPFALMISLIVGVTNIIPFFGPFIGAIPSVFILLLEEPIEALYFIIIIVVIQQLDGNIIGPKIVGNAIGISSFWVLVSVLIGGGLFGFGGMAFGVPVFAVFYRYVDKLTRTSLKRKEKNTHTSYYYSLEPFGLEDDEVDLEPDPKKQQSLFTRFKKEKKDIYKHKFAYDTNDHESDLDRSPRVFDNAVDNGQETDD